MKAEVFAGAIGSVAALLAEPTLAARAVDCAKVIGALCAQESWSTSYDGLLKVSATATITITTTSTVYVHSSPYHV
jgi:hypothetical protein